MSMVEMCLNRRLRRELVPSRRSPSADGLHEVQTHGLQGIQVPSRPDLERIGALVLSQYRHGTARGTSHVGCTKLLSGECRATSAAGERVTGQAGRVGE